MSMDYDLQQPGIAPAKRQRTPGEPVLSRVDLKRLFEEINAVGLPSYFDCSTVPGFPSAKVETDNLLDRAVISSAKSRIRKSAYGKR